MEIINHLLIIRIYNLTNYFLEYLNKKHNGGKKIKKRHIDLKNI
jgi:hypothetical protein